MAHRRTDDGNLTDPSRPHHDPDQREDDYDSGEQGRKPVTPPSQDRDGEQDTGRSTPSRETGR